MKVVITMFLDQQADLIIYLQSFRNTFTEFVMNATSLLGEPEFYILLLGFFYWVYNKRLGEFLGVSLGITLALNNVLKAFFMIERPFLAHEEIENLRMYTATGSAFPSGHMQGATTVFFAIARFFNLKKLWLLAIFVAIMMGLSRMFLGVHYLQDVVIGGTIGFLIAIGAYKVFDTFRKNERGLHFFYLAIIIAFLPGLFLLDINAPDVNDFFRSYGILAGFVAAVLFEKRFVGFTMEITPLKKLIRYVTGVVLVMLVMIVLGELFSLARPVFVNGFDFIRFFFVAFIGFGLYPWLFTKFGF